MEGTIVEYSVDTRAEIERLESDPTGVKVATDFRRAHPIIRQMRRSRTPDPNGEWDESRLSIGVSTGSERRALLILDAIFRAVEKFGFEIHVEKNKAYLLREDVKMPLTLSEHYKRFEYTAEGSKRNWGHRHYFEPDGVLSLVLERWGIGHSSRTWKDLGSGALEGRLTKIVGEIITSFDLMRQEQVKRRIEEEREVERRRRVELRRSQLVEENHRCRDLLRIIRMRERAIRLKIYLHEFETSAAEVADGLHCSRKFLVWAGEQVAQMTEEADRKLRELIQIVDGDIIRTESPQIPLNRYRRPWSSI